ncbi:hypothetical protein BH10PLA1_BH10PLA1_05160 [soil metagenome]
MVVSALGAPRVVRAETDDIAFSVTLYSNAYYSPGRWQPVRIQISNRTKSPITGEAVMPFEGQNEKVSFHLPLTVPARSRLLTTSYIYVPPMPEPAGNRKLVGGGQQLCVAEWRNQGGAMLVRCPVLGFPTTDNFVTNTTTSAEPIDGIRVDRAFLFTLSDYSDLSAGEVRPGRDSAIYAEGFQTVDDSLLRNLDRSIAEAPRDLLGYDSAALVAMDGSPGDLDPAQQQALIDYMITGGTIVLSAPLGPTDPAETWLAPYLPARRIGKHYTSAVSGQFNNSTRTYKTVAPLDVCEWAALPASGDVHVVMADKHYVHAAYRQVGLGRLVVTSFPLAGLDVKDRAVRELWSRLVLSPRGVPVENSGLASTQSQMLESMVGLKVPPWIVAAGIVCGYVALVLAIQLIARQGQRPLGFTVAIGLAILIAAGLLVFSLFRDHTIQLSMARIDVLDLDHGGVRSEGASLLGPEGTAVALTASPGTSLRQAPSADDKPLALTISPLSSRGAAVYPRRIERVWQSSGPVPASQVLHAAGQFNERGLSLTIDNTIGPVTGAVLVGQRGRFALPELATGTSTADAIDGEKAGGIRLDTDQLRDRILNAALTPVASIAMRRSTIDDSIYLAGWLNEAPPPLLQFAAGQAPAVQQSNALVRTLMEIQPSPIGSTVHISRAFTQMVGNGGALGPYDPVRREWIDAFSGQEFLIGFSYPSGAGKLKVTKAKLDLQAEAPQQTITVRRGQCTGGKAASNPAGPIVGQWKGLSTTSTEFDVSPADMDANGWVWLLVTVGSPAEQSKWRIKDLALSYDGQIIGLPQAVVMPEPVARPPEPDVPSKPVAKKPPAKKATPKPAKPTTKASPPPKKKASKPQ